MRERVALRALAAKYVTHPNSCGVGATRNIRLRTKPRRSRSLVKGDDIGAFRDHRDAGVPGAGDCASNRSIEIGGHLDPGQVALLVR